MSLVNTLMQPLRSQYTEAFDKNELRPSRYGALQAFQRDTAEAPIFDPETLANIKRSFGNSVVVPVLNAQDITVSPGYARTCAIVDDENTSALVTLTFQSYGWAFSMTPATHYNNEVDYQRDFTRKVEKYVLAFASALDNLCIAQLEADKNQLWTGIAPDFYAQVGDALQVPQTDKSDKYNVLESIMAVADFYDTIKVITSTSEMPNVRFFEQQGAQNNTNLEFQFRLRGYEFYPTNRIPNGGGVESTAYACERGSLFIDNRNDADTVLGGSIGGDVKVWDEVSVPVVNMLMGSYYQQDCADRSAIAGGATAGNTRSRVEGFEWSTDIVTATAYNSDIATRYNPIMKIETLA